MNLQWIGLILAAAPASVGALHPSCPGTNIDAAVIVAHSSRPTAISSFSLIWVKLNARTQQTGTDEFYMPYMVSDQFIPPANSVCKVTFHTDRVSGGTAEGPIPNDRALKIVDELSCDSGAFVMKW